MDDPFTLPDFDDDEPEDDVEAHSADPSIAPDDEPDDDDVEAHGQSSFR